MATITYSSGIYTLTGPCFYAILNSALDRTIYDVGYLPNNQQGNPTRIRSKRPFVADVNGLSTTFGGELPAFLFTMYQSSIELGNTSIEHDLDTHIQSNGLDYSIGAAGYEAGEYDLVEALDFTVLTGRKYYPYSKMIKHLKLPENYIEGTNPPEFNVTERPELSDVEDGTDDSFLNTIKHLGISGIIARMYGRGAMTWAEYLECANHFWLGDMARIQTEIGRLVFLSPILFRPSLTSEKKAQLMSIGSGTFTSIPSI